jgi:glycerol-3-phosphate dehydrogenase
VTRDDVAYLLEPLARTFRTPPVAPDEVIGAWAGLRPLISQPGRPPTEISRRDEVLIGPGGMVTIAGGKLTGYRPMARATLERAAELVGLRLRDAPDDDPVLPGGDFAGDVDVLAASVAREGGVAATAAARLVRLHGSEAFEVVRTGAAALAPGLDILAGEIDRAVSHEGALHLEDVVYRRTRAAWFEPGAREHALVPAATRMGALLGWDEARRLREIASTAARIDAELSFRTAIHPQSRGSQ